MEKNVYIYTYKHQESIHTSLFILTMNARVRDVYTGWQGYPFCANTLLLLLFTKMSVTLERSVAVLHKKARAGGVEERKKRNRTQSGSRSRLFFSFFPFAFLSTMNASGAAGPQKLSQIYIQNHCYSQNVGFPFARSPAKNVTYLRNGGETLIFFLILPPVLEKTKKTPRVLDNLGKYTHINIRRYVIFFHRSLSSSTVCVFPGGKVLWGGGYCYLLFFSIHILILSTNCVHRLTRKRV